MRFCWTVCVATILLAGGVVSAADALHLRIDQLVDAKYDGPAAPQTSDAEFLRRLSLDLAGVIPTAADARAFLDDASSDKRIRLVDSILSGEAYPRRMQQFLTVMLLERRVGATVPMDEWESYLESLFHENRPLDQIVAELISTDGTNPATRPAMKFFLARSPTDHKLLALDLSRLLLGRNLECAQCHDHPSIDDYKQAHFYGLVAFLDRSYLYKDKSTSKQFYVEKGIGDELEFTSVFTSITGKTGPRLPGAPSLDVPVFEAGQELATPASDGNPPVPKFPLRPHLATQLTSSDNAMFARNMANRLWAMMMGRGIVHPLDMHHSLNPPSNPELLELLTNELIAREFDVRDFLRELSLSKTYQRSSRIGDNADAVKPETFAAFNLKPLSAEQLALSVIRATGNEARILATPSDPAATAKYRPDKGHPIPAENVSNVLKLFRSIYAEQPGQAEVDFSPSIAAALFSENEELLLKWLTPGDANLSAQLTSEDDPDKLAEELYFSILTRQPSDEERDSVKEYLHQAGADRESALREMAWALLASTEFRFNH